MYRLRPLFAVLLLGASWISLADVQVNLPQETLTQGQPFRIGFEAQGAGANRPDLAPLARDFDIVQQNSSRSSRNINGQSSQRTSLNLTLVPKRSGDLEIPALQFGQERSAPVRIKVAAAGDAGTSLAPTDPGAGLGPPSGYAPPYPMAGSSAGPGQGGTSPSSPPWGGMPGYSGWTSPGGTPPWSATPGGQGWQPPSAPGLSLPPAPAASPPAEAGSDAGYWPWFTALALTGWLLTSLALWRVLLGQPILPARPAPLADPAPAPVAVTPAAAPALAPAQPVPVEPPAPKSRLDPVRQAFDRNDPFAAKDALLHWASSVWPLDPPTNLSRLAVRCPPQVQRHLLKLDEALYSPTQVDWRNPSLFDALEQIAAQAGSQGSTHLHS